MVAQFIEWTRMMSTRFQDPCRSHAV